MTWTIELTEQEARRVEEAQAQGVDVAALVHNLISDLPCPEVPKVNKTAELFDQWERGAIPLLLEEAAKEDAEWEQMMQNIRANRFDLPVPDVSGDCRGCRVEVSPRSA